MLPITIVMRFLGAGLTLHYQAIPVGDTVNYKQSIL